MSADETPRASVAPPPGPQAGSRLVSLDAFRGLTVAGMILVNNPGSVRDAWPQLRHAPWHGLTLADLVFPFFLLIVGVSVTLALGRRVDEGARRPELVAKILRRTLLLIALGLVLNLLRPDLALGTVRIPGILQRIALCYLGSALLMLTGSVVAQALTTVGLLAGYWVVLLTVPVPGHGAGMLTPEGNVAGWVDRMVLGSHTWQHSGSWDPEGVLSTFPALATTLIGVLAGHWLRRAPSPVACAAGLLAAGSVLTGLGQLTGTLLPVNKNLWTSSYAVLTAGLGLLLLTIFVGAIDGCRIRSWARPLVMLGMNPLAIFFFSSLLTRALLWLHPWPGAPTLHRLLYAALFAPLAPPPVASLLWALSHVCLSLLAAWWLHRRRTFIKL